MAVNSVTTTTTPPAGTQGTRDTSGTLGKDAFLKILVGQMQHQDPMAQNQDGGQMIAQMAQFSQLEQETNTAQASDQLVRASTLGLIGRTVTYTDSSNAPQTGVVAGVDISKDGVATLTVGDKSGIDAGKVTQVR